MCQPRAARARDAAVGCRRELRFSYTLRIVALARTHFLAHQSHGNRCHIRVEDCCGHFREVLHGSTHDSFLQREKVERRPCAIAQEEQDVSRREGEADGERLRLSSSESLFARVVRQNAALALAVDEIGPRIADAHSHRIVSRECESDERGLRSPE